MTKTHSILGSQATRGSHACLMPPLSSHLLHLLDFGRFWVQVFSRSFPERIPIRLPCVGACFFFLYTLSHVRITVQCRPGKRVAAELLTIETRILRTFSRVPSRYIGDHLDGNLCMADHWYLRRIVLSACGSTRTTSSRLVFADFSGGYLP